ncbi:nucleoside triphosphatase YtkD [Cerasibacillus terrae]|uniref:Nucleoside triphosphatase YtkD n=1 Tax=Cerasibacillus terrae TaxID=2498845 RepID=A0A5C8NF37_9BACI|nr:nucleoside triphosphatase YtkD [Cerasibacillus terrae]TXL58167.1 nucleoside triphosphatase YtkD [Cerasibacillus terrae]
MYIFTDYYRNKVQLSFENHPFSRLPKHVWVICKYNHQWLLTEHKERGLEFPGGKVEEGETAEQAAVREVKEETGGIVGFLEYIGQYYVNGKNGDVIKNVYFANIEKLIKQDTYFETNGPVLLNEIPTNVKQLGHYSFIMKDDVLTYCMEKINE